MSSFAGAGLRRPLWILLLLIPLVFFWQMIIGGQEPLAPDTQAVRPLSVWVQETRAELGETPLWCPAIFSGMPSYGSFIHTPSSPLDLTRWLRKPFQDARGARYYISLILAGLGLYGWLRLRRRHPVSALGGALVFVMTPYILGLVAAGHSTKLHALCLAPLVFLAIEVLLQKRTLAAAALLAAAVALQLWNNHPQISYYTLLIGGLYGLSTVLLDRPPRWRGRGAWAGLGLAAAGLLIAAGLVLEPYGAVLEYVPYSIRGGGALAGDGGGGAGWDYATAWSYPPSETLAFLFPSWFGLEGATYWGELPFTQSTHYFGVTALLLAILGLALTVGRRKWIWVALGAAVLVIGFGRHFPLLYWPAYELLPMFDRFRVPSMIYALLPLLVAALAAAGLDAVLRGGPWLLPRRTAAAQAKGRRAPRHKGGDKSAKVQQTKTAVPAGATHAAPDWGRRLLGRWTIVTAILGVLLLFWLVAGSALTAQLEQSGTFVRAGEAERYGAQLSWLTAQRAALLRDSVAWGLLLLALSAGLVEARRRRLLPGVWTAALLVAVLLVDLWAIDRQFYHPVPRSRTEAVLAEDAIVRALREIDRERDALGRIAPLTANEFGSNRYAAFGIESVGGYQPAKLRIYDDLIRSGAIYSLLVLSMLNARYLLTDRALPQEFPQLARAATPGGGELRLYENPAALPRAWFAREIAILPDEATVLAQMTLPEFEPARVAYLSAPTAVTLPDSISPGEVRALRHGPHEIDLDVRVRGPHAGLLVLSEINYPPGWRATVDGEPTQVRVVDYLLRGLPVPPGEHRVRLAAVSPGLQLGRWASRAAAGALLLLLLLGALGKRRSGRRSA
ncbi:MAG: YfhO family protein [Candidatus Eisenbacteria bacterium]|nr:YfhO family protein [Candidatus Eisenbacteria bacterium]